MSPSPLALSTLGLQSHIQWSAGCNDPWEVGTSLGMIESHAPWDDSRAGTWRRAWGTDICTQGCNCLSGCSFWKSQTYCHRESLDQTYRAGWGPCFSWAGNLFNRHTQLSTNHAVTIILFRFRFSYTLMLCEVFGIGSFIPEKTCLANFHRKAARLSDKWPMLCSLMKISSEPEKS